MSEVMASTLPLPNDEEEAARNEATKTTAGGAEAVQWEVVAETPGLLQAEILAGRLRVEGLSVRIWQEGAGRAIGLTVGLLGTGYVAVPAEYAEQAREILELGDEEE